MTMKEDHFQMQKRLLAELFKEMAKPLMQDALEASSRYVGELSKDRLTPLESVDPKPVIRG